MATATATTRSPIRVWLMVLGWVLVATAILGLVKPVADALHGLSFHIEGGEMFLHWVLAFLTLGLAYLVRNDATLANIGIAYGLVYIVVGVLGFFVKSVSTWHVGVGDNILHLALGALTLVAAFVSRNRDVGTRTRGSAV